MDDQQILTGKVKDTITIRSRRPGDAGYIAHRHGVLYTREYGLEPVLEQYVLEGLVAYLSAPKGGEIWVAECGERIIGSIGMVRASAVSAQLRWFLIEPEYRGFGLGRKMVATGIGYCKEQGYKHVFLWTFKGLDAARRLYEQFGFTLTEEKLNNDWKTQLTEQRWDLQLDV